MFGWKRTAPEDDDALVDRINRRSQREYRENTRKPSVVVLGVLAGGNLFLGLGVLSVAIVATGIHTISEEVRVHWIGRRRRPIVRGVVVEESAALNAKV